MAIPHRASTTAVLIVCLIGGPWAGAVFASGQEPSPGDQSESQSVSAASPVVPGPASIFTLTDEKLWTDASAGSTSAAAWRGTFTAGPTGASSFEQRRYGGRGRSGRDGAVAAIILGAAATIAGTAILVYANRPDCNTNQMASGCGYGTKVAGGAVLSAGIVGLVVGAVLWR